MRFRDRGEAASLLADRLSGYKGLHPLVLGVPRGAVPMARIIANALAGDLDVVLVRKLRAPGQPELAIGAVDEAGTVFEGDYFAVADEAYIRDEMDEQLEVLRARREQYTQAHPPIDPAGRIVIIVDDGIATGSSMFAAIRSVKARNARKVVVAVGVAPPQTLIRMRGEADEVVCLHAPAGFYAVGQFFDDFSEVTDDMVVAALSRAGLTDAGSSSSGSSVSRGASESRRSFT
jgi:predicted phosphoribosyltransferase